MFIQGRLKFNDMGTAPFPSVFVVMGQTKEVVWSYIFKEKL